MVSCFPIHAAMSVEAVWLLAHSLCDGTQALHLAGLVLNTSLLRNAGLRGPRCLAGHLQGAFILSHWWSLLALEDASR